MSLASVTIRNLHRSDIAAAHTLLGGNGCVQRIDSVERFALLLDRSQRIAVAVPDGEVAGFAWP